MRSFTLVLTLLFAPLSLVAQDDAHLVLFSGMAGYWNGSMEMKEGGETKAVYPAALDVRLAQDGSQLITQLYERPDEALLESSQLITYQADSLLIISSGVRSGDWEHQRFHVQGLQKIRSPFHWVIRRVGAGAVSTLRMTDIMQNDSLLIVTEKSENGTEWQTSNVLRLARHVRPEPVRFSLPGYDRATRVAVIGDFNNWNPRRALLHRGRGGWALSLELPPGEYQYAFDVDGVKVPDRLVSTTIGDGAGGYNAIIVVR